MVHRVGLQPHPRHRSGRRSGRTLCPAPAPPPRPLVCLTMELTLWTYEGPPHVGAMRIAASMEGVHYVLHAPQGDTYADLLFTMIERR
ncbi:MAG: ferredoxin:protochlorophyllide reductase (ATP-dependent) subunit B, partial [Vulcanococcus sp.]